MKAKIVGFAFLTAMASGQAGFAQEPVRLNDATEAAVCESGNCIQDPLPRMETMLFANTLWQVHPFQLSHIDQLEHQQAGWILDRTPYTKIRNYDGVIESRSWFQNLASMRDLKLVTFWQGSASSVFFGVSSDGLAGLNIARDKLEKDEKTEAGAFGLLSRSIGPLSPPLVHSQSLTYEKQDLSLTIAADLQ